MPRRRRRQRRSPSFFVAVASSKPLRAISRRSPTQESRALAAAAACCCCCCDDCETPTGRRSHQAAAAAAEEDAFAVSTSPLPSAPLASGSRRSRRLPPAKWVKTAALPMPRLRHAFRHGRDASRCPPLSVSACCFDSWSETSTDGTTFFRERLPCLPCTVKSHANLRGPCYVAGTPNPYWRTAPGVNDNMSSECDERGQ